MATAEGLDPLEQRQLELLEEIKHPTSPLYLFALLDALVTLYDECTRVEKNSYAQKFVERCEFYPFFFPFFFFSPKSSHSWLLVNRWPGGVKVEKTEAVKRRLQGHQDSWPGSFWRGFFLFFPYHLSSSWQLLIHCVSDR